MDRDTLKIKSYHIGNVCFGNSASFRDFKQKGTLQILQEFPSNDPDILSVDIKVLKPSERHIQINTIMDVIPISTKVLGSLGYGTTHTLTGVYFILTGRSDTGEQFHSFGSSEGYLDEQMRFGKCGTPGENDLLILMDIVTVKEAPFNRALMMKVFGHADEYLQTIRDEMKLLSGRDASEVHEYTQKPLTGQKPRVAIVKQVSGQGAMYDHMVFPKEPSGFASGISIIDVNNMPVVLSPNEFRDGAVRALN